MIHVKKIRKPKSGNTSGSGAGSGFAAPSAGSSDYSEKAGYASQAGHAETAARATRADMAEQLTDEVWQQIDNKDAETLAAAKNYANGNFLSKKNNDTAQGFIQFLAGIGIGHAETWGYVKKVTENGVEKVKSWFKNLWTDVLTVTNHLTGNGGLLNIKGNVAIAKDTANNKSGDISVAGAGNFGGGVSAKNGHFSGDVTADKGQFNDVTTHDLTVTGTAHFFELVIDSVKTAGGAAIFTPADGFKVEAVTKFFYDGSWRVRLWWKATDGEKAIKNMWRQGMQAICKNFNEAKPGQYSDVSNHNYWSVVAWTETLRGEDNQGTTPTWDSTNIAYEEGKPNPYEVTDWHILDLYSNADDSAERHPIPNYHLGGKPVYEGEPWTAAVGDNISQLGYRGDDNLLKNALYISAYTSLDTGDFTRGIRGLQAPLIAYYEGVDDFNLSAHRTTFKDALGGEWIGSMKVVAGDGQITLDEYINRVVDIDIDAEFYRLRALKEEAFVDASKKLTVNLEYQLEHVANGTATVMGAWDGFFIESINNAGTTEGSWSPSGNRKIYRLSIGNYSEAQNPSYFVIQLKESATSNVIYTRVVRVAMKPGAIFEVTDGRIGAAVQAIGENMEQMRSEFEMTAQGIRSEVSNLPSRGTCC